MTAGWGPIGGMPTSNPLEAWRVPSRYACDWCGYDGPRVFDVIVPTAVHQNGRIRVTTHQSCESCESVHVHPAVPIDGRVDVLRWDAENVGR